MNELSSPAAKLGVDAIMLFVFAFRHDTYNAYRTVAN